MSDVGERATKSSVRVTRFKTVVRGQLRGFAGVTWDAAGLRFKEVSADGKGWCGLPAVPVIVSAGRHHVIAGRKQYRPVLKWRDRARSEAFSEHVIAALLRKHPHALDDEAA